MAYCEVVTKIGNELERLDLNDPPAYSCSMPNMTNSIVSEIMEDLIGDAVSEAEQKSKKEKLKAGIHSGGKISLRANVGDMVDDIVVHPDINMKRNSYTSTRTMEEDKKMSNESVICATKCDSPSRGIGDQLMASEEILPVKESTSAVIKHPVVEKKSRLTDLVKNSKQILSKFILSDNLRGKHDEWEEKNEKLLKIVELDCVKENMEPFKVNPTQILPENVPLPDDSDDLLQPAEEAMEIVDLKHNASTSQMKSTGSSACADSDELKKTMTFPVTASSSRTLRGRFSTMKISSKDFHLRKRKWNFGSKIINYIRKRSTKSKKETEKDMPE